MGLGTPLCCVQNLPPRKHKAFTQTKRMVQRVAESFIDPGVKIIEDNGAALAATASSSGSGSGSGSMEEEEMLGVFVPGSSSSKVTFSATSPASEMTRAIVACTVKDISWRSTRSTVLGDSLELLDCLPEAPDSNRIRVTGYLRGAPLYMHSLIHILGVNTCTLESVEVGNDPLTAASRRLKGQSHRGGGGERLLGDGSEGDANVSVFRADPSKQDSLVMESSPDTLMGEQTWPSEDELLHMTSVGDGMAGRDQRHVPTSIPTGMSSYQADWYVDEKGNFEPEYEELEKEGVAEGKGSVVRVMGDEEDTQVMQGGDDDDDDDDDDNMTLDGSILNMANFPGGASAASQPKKSKLRAAQEDDEFPDEIDTPEDVAARVRFARYRNLQSFRTSPWHSKENLPAEYSRIYQFENFNMAQRAALNHLKAVKSSQDSQKLESRAASVASSKASRSRVSSFATGGSQQQEELTEEMGGMGEEGGDNSNSGSLAAASSSSSHVVRGADDFIATGQYVSLVLSNVSPAVVEAYRVQGFTALFSLLPHENKLTVLHFTVERRDGYDEPIKSKEVLTFQVGFRSFTGRPIFSEINLNCDKHKVERFFRKGTLSMASVYGPVTFLPCPLLVFKKHERTGAMVLVATGALSAIDPDRIMLKKVILTGVPIRVRKRSAVVRQLFYDPQVRQRQRQRDRYRETEKKLTETSFALFYTALFCIALVLRLCDDILFTTPSPSLPLVSLALHPSVFTSLTPTRLCSLSLLSISLAVRM